jgi:DNA-binding SARP family transcriptional activator/transcriptional regulator with XRE-family HTH domain
MHHAAIMQAHPAGLGAVIRQHRIAAGMTQRELATAANVSIGALRDLEQGRTAYPRWVLVRSVVSVLGVDQAAVTGSPAMRAHDPDPASMADGDGPRAGKPAAHVHIQVFGRLAAMRNGREVSLGSDRQRGVLGLLAMHHGTSVSQSEIIDALWTGRPPQSAQAMVHRYIWRLRKALSPAGQPGRGGSLIATIGRCYRLDAAPAQLDVAAFRQLAAEARRKEETTPQAAYELCAKALGLWRGEPLTDIDFLHDHPATAELASVGNDLILRYASLAIRLGDPASALGYLGPRCAADAFNEKAHTLLMKALAADGQPAAALTVYHRLEQRLSRELGVAPGPLVTAAYADIRRSVPGASALRLVRDIPYQADKSHGAQTITLGDRRLSVLPLYTRRHPGPPWIRLAV